MPIATIALVLHGCGGSSAPPAVSLSASTTDVKIGSSVTLTWSSTNASSCVASNGWSGNLATAGSQTQTVVESSTYTVSCSGANGDAIASATVTAWEAPQASISADATDVFPNNTVLLSWSSRNSATCSGGDGLSGSLATSGSQTSPSLTSKTVFTVSCSNPVYPAVNASVTVNVSPTLTLNVSVQYQVPGDPVPDPNTGYLVPDWTKPVSAPVPYVWVELQDPNGGVVQHTFADANGVATFSGLEPTGIYTPVIRSEINDPAIGLDFVVSNNTAPVDTSQPTYRARYAPYLNSGSAYTPDKRLATQNLGTIVATDGWDSSQKKLVDASSASGG
ncbi:MAG TPA: hypothetical protein VN730_06130 [Steroidobacteraceae bacterium]|nr:hypothetical protein [Steroidobacteraceae bacterium]